MLLRPAHEEGSPFVSAFCWLFLAASIACWSFSACASIASILASIALSWFSNAAAVLSPLASSWKAYTTISESGLIVGTAFSRAPWPDLHHQRRGYHSRSLQVSLPCYSIRVSSRNLDEVYERGEEDRDNATAESAFVHTRLTS